MLSRARYLSRHHPFSISNARLTPHTYHQPHTVTWSIQAHGPHNTPTFKRLDVLVEYQLTLMGQIGQDLPSGHVYSSSATHVHVPSRDHRGLTRHAHHTGTHGCFCCGYCWPQKLEARHSCVQSKSKQQSFSSYLLFPHKSSMDITYGHS